jgi:glycosyltransferase involved in cell wall biosynthesis
MTLSIVLSNLRGFLAKKFLPRAKWKTYEKWANNGYNHHPRVSFVIQSHNKSAEVMLLVSRLRECPFAEIIVIDDGSTSAHSKRLVRFLNGGNEFVLRMNDLYEVVSYDRAIQFARGQYVALLQDDDGFDDLAWVDEAISLFEKFSQMVILGGRDGLRYDSFSPDGVKREIVSLRNKENTSDFQFVQTINRAPMFIHRPLFTDHLKHIDFSYAPFQFDDVELCLRAWQKGLQVGWYPVWFYSLSQGGMRIGNRGLGQEQAKKNSEKLNQTYKTADLEQINRQVEEANQLLKN